MKISFDNGDWCDVHLIEKNAQSKREYMWCMVTNVTCDGWLGANEFVTNTVSRAVTVHKTLLLLTANLFIVRVSEESLGTGADSLVTQRGALSIATTDHRTRAGIFTLKQTILPANTGVRLVAVDIIGAARFLDTQAVLTAMEWGALCGVLTLADTGATIAQLVVQTLS